MAEQASFEARAVLAPRRARVFRFVLALPVLALGVIVWAGVSGSRPDQAASVPEATTVDASPAGAGQTAAAPVVLAAYPSRVPGLDVQGLGDVQLARLTRDDVVALAGWYVPLAITDCPSVVETIPGTSFPQPHPGYDPWAYCERSGVLYASHPRTRAGELGGGPSSVVASLVTGIKLPRELERVGADPMQVVVLGHFVESSSACMLLGACPTELVVDYLGWAAGA